MNASAFVVGASDGPAAALADLSRRIGFQSVERYAGLRLAERQASATPLLFFLCAAVSDVATLKPVVDAIRFSPSFNLRFSPLIYFAHDPSVADIRQCAAMGFDDVIALPYAAGDIKQRVFRQVGQPHVYYETATYFGPDRRNRDRDPKKTPKTHDGEGEFRRIEIVRNPETGVDVLHDDQQIVL